MNIPKHLLNVIGAALVVGILLAGLSLVALPVYVESSRLDSERQIVAQANNAQAAQVESLRKQAETLPSLKAEVDKLSEQIPSASQIDTVAELAVSAAQSSGVKLTTIDVGEITPFIAANGASSTPTATASATPTSGSGTEAQTQQVQLKITVTTTKISDIAGFLDGLRAGPRLLRIDETSVTADTGSKTFTATVTVSAFLRTA